MPRRRSRLRSSQLTAGRWKPPLPLVVLVAGMLVGFALGIRGRLFDQSASLQEHYMLLVSDLFAQGVPLSSTRDRLLSLGFSDPSVAVVGVADQLAASPDKVKQQEADQLHQFAAALAAGSEHTTTGPATPPLVVATVPPVPSPVILSPVAAVVSVPSATQVAPATPLPAATPTPATPAQAQATPAAPSKTAVVRSSDRQPVFLRRDPTSKSLAMGILPYGSTVDVTGVVQGEAIDSGESRWYHVTFRGHPGYVYAKFIQIGG